MLLAQNSLGKNKGVSEMIRKSLLSLFLLISLSGCDQQAWLEDIAPTQETAFAKEHVTQYRSRNYAAIEAKINPTVKETVSRARLEEIASFFPQEEPKDITVVGWHVLNSPNMQRADLTLQYEFSNKWLLTNIFLQKSGDTFLVNGINVKPLSDSLENINSFTFQDKGISNYIVLISAIVIPLFIVGVLILCIKTPIPKRKWLWILFVLLGFVQITLNWTTGDINVTPLYFQILGAGFWKTPYGPMLISISLPLGAIVFLLKRKQWMRRAEST